MLYIHTPQSILVSHSETLKLEIIAAIEKAMFMVDHLTDAQQNYIFSITQKDPELRNIFRFTSTKLIPQLHTHLIEALKQLDFSNRRQLQVAWGILQYLAHMHLEKDTALAVLDYILWHELDPRLRSEFEDLKVFFQSI